MSSVIIHPIHGHGTGKRTNFSGADRHRDGTLELPARLPLPEKAHARAAMESGAIGRENVERSAWLKLSEEALTTTWDNPGDDVFNELLKRYSRPATDFGWTLIS